jgi:hypothetical protein
MSPHISGKNESQVPGALPTTAMPSANSGSGLDEILTKKQLAERLHVTVRSLENWQRRGILRYVKIGKIVLFIWGDVLESLKQFRVSRRTSK